jgi:hypothetical protein
MDKSAGLIVRSVKPHLESVRANKHLAVFTLANLGPIDIEIIEIATALIAEAKSELINPATLRFEVMTKSSRLQRGKRSFALRLPCSPRLICIG